MLEFFVVIMRNNSVAKQKGQVQAGNPIWGRRESHMLLSDPIWQLSYTKHPPLPALSPGGRTTGGIALDSVHARGDWVYNLRALSCWNVNIYSLGQPLMSLSCMHVFLSLSYIQTSCTRCAKRTFDKQRWHLQTANGPWPLFTSTRPSLISPTHSDLSDLDLCLV